MGRSRRHWTLQGSFPQAAQGFVADMSPKRELTKARPPVFLAEVDSKSSWLWHLVSLLLAFAVGVFPDSARLEHALQHGFEVVAQVWQQLGAAGHPQLAWRTMLMGWRCSHVPNAAEVSFFPAQNTFLGILVSCNSGWRALNVQSGPRRGGHGPHPP